MNGTPDLTGSWLNFAQQPVEQGGLGLAPHQAAGLVGNLVNESGRSLSPWGPTGDNGTAWGTAQWRGDRLNALKSMFPNNYQTPEAQQAFMRSEMLGSENKAYKALLAAGSPEDAAAAVNHLYERSADNSGRREAAARQLMAQFGGAGGGASPALALADEDGEEGGDNSATASPALSANSTLGTGALQQLMPAIEKSENKHRISSGLVGMAAALASISSPQQAYALSGIAKQLKDEGEDDKTSYKISVGKDGRILRIGSNGQVDAIGGNPAGATGVPQMLGDTSKTGQDYMTTLPPVAQKMVGQMLDGSLAPSSYSLKSPEMQQYIAAAQQVDPTFDLSSWKARYKMQTDMGSSGPSSMGGILSNGMSAFKHLGLASDALANLGNSNGYDGIGGGLFGQASNFVHNNLASPETQTKLSNATAALGRYGQESTKFYAGTGGGVHERAEALKANDPFKTTGAQQAGFLGAEKDLMMERLREKENQVRQVMGDAYLQKHPITEAPELKTLLSRIDANIEKLHPTKKEQPQSKAATTTVTPQPGKSYVWTPQGLQEK